MIKVTLNSAKEVSTLYHFTKTAEQFYSICDQLEIRAGITEEKGPGHTKSKFISFTRDLKLFNTTRPRYKCGFVLNGEQMSEYFRIEPISYAGYSMTNKGSSIRLSILTAYDDNTYTMYIRNIGTISISRDLFTKLANVLDNLSEEMKTKKKLEISIGKRRIKGKMIIKKYVLNSPNGLVLNTTTIPELNEFVNDIAATDKLYEGEERIWESVVYIESALQGVVIDKQLSERELLIVRDSLQLLYDQGYRLKPDEHSELGFADSAAFRIIRV